MSKLIICENCFSEQSATNKFCSCCGKPITKNVGYDIYNKEEKYYLRYRKDGVRVQTPLAPNYPSLALAEKRTTYTAAKKVLLTKISARSLINSGAIKDIATFNDLLDNYLNYVGRFKLNSNHRGRIKNSTYDVGYISRVKTIKRFPIINLKVADITYDTMRNAIMQFVNQRVSGEIVGHSVSAQMIERDLHLIRKTIDYSFEEGLLVLTHAQLQKLHRFILEITPIDDEDTASKRRGLSEDQYNNFLLIYFSDWPNETLEELFLPLLSKYETDPILHLLLRLMFSYFSHPMPDLYNILELCKNGICQRLNNTYTKPQRFKEYSYLKKLITAKYTKEKSSVPIETFAVEVVDSYAVQCLTYFPECYKEFSEMIETKRFNGLYYPVKRSYYHGTKLQKACHFDSTRPDAQIIYKRVQERFKEGTSLQSLTLLFTSQTGLRINEAHSLKLADFDSVLQNGKEIKTVCVSHQATYVIELDENNKPVQHTNGRYKYNCIESTPKTKSSKRIIALTPIAVYAFEQAIKLTGATEPEDRVFVQEIRNNNRAAVIKQSQNTLSNLRCTDLSGTHLFRKTTASQLARHGYSEYYIKQILGHTKSDVTDLYVNIDLSNMYTALCKSLVPEWLRDRFPIN